MWERVVDELDIWHRQKRRALFWWRDDDAVDVTPQLNRLVSLARVHDVGIGLSVIPVASTPALQRFVRQHAQIDVLVHGFAHVNHARPDESKREFGGNRSQTEMVRDLVEGLALIRGAFGARSLPVLVPPWNRINPGIVMQLPRLGYSGLSTWKPRPVRHRVAALRQVNAHLDVIDWRRGKVPKNERLVASLLLRKLRWRRLHPSRAKEPLGILTHHLLWSPEIEGVLAGILTSTRKHPAAGWLSARDAFEF